MTVQFAPRKKMFSNVRHLEVAGIIMMKAIISIRTNKTNSSIGKAIEFLEKAKEVLEAARDERYVDFSEALTTRRAS